MYVPEVVRKSLNLSYSCCRNAEWLLRSDEFYQAADAAISYALHPNESLNGFLIKESSNRSVFRLKVDSERSDISSVIVKSFPMKHLYQRLYRYRRYGPREAAHLLKAKSRGIPVPGIYGYGQISSLGLVDSTIVMMEDLNRHQSISDIFSAADLQDSGKIEILKRMGSLLVRLYEGSCNHIDINGQSILLGATQVDDRLIDFHYVAFHQQPSLTVLMFNMAYFGNSIGDAVSEALLESWVRETLTQLSITDSDPWIEAYREFKSKRLSRKQRLAIR